MEQRCHLVMVWLTWLGLPVMAGAIALGLVVLLAGRFL